MQSARLNALHRELHFVCCDQHSNEVRIRRNRCGKLRQQKIIISHFSFCNNSWYENKSFVNNIQWTSNTAFTPINAMTLKGAFIISNARIESVKQNPHDDFTNKKLSIQIMNQFSIELRNHWVTHSNKASCRGWIGFPDWIFFIYFVFVIAMSTINNHFQSHSFYILIAHPHPNYFRSLITPFAFFVTILCIPGSRISRFDSINSNDY